MKTKHCNFCGSDRYEERCIEYSSQDPCAGLCSGVGFGHRLWLYLTSLSEGKTDVFGVPRQWLPANLFLMQEPSCRNRK